MSPPQAPTTSLPPLGRLYTYSTLQIHTSLTNLRSLYLPHTTSSVRGPASLRNAASPQATASSSAHTTLKRSPLGYLTPIIDSGYASAEEDSDSDSEDGNDEHHDGNTNNTDVQAHPQCCELLCTIEDLEAECKTLEVLRADTFERTFAIRWLTGFVARAEEWVETACSSPDGADREGEEGDGEGEGGGEMALRNELLEEALDILSAFTTADNDEEEEEDRSYTRVLSFKTKGIQLSQQDGTDSGEQDEEETLTVEINDAPINGEDHTSVGLQTWGSSIIFAERLCASSWTYLQALSRQGHLQADKCTPQRILELGAGTGILSIVAAKLFHSANASAPGGQRIPEIVATDYHPDVLRNLKANVATNFPDSADQNGLGGVPPIIDVHKLDWENPVYDAPLDRRFELVLAADVVYHPEHARWIKGVVERLLVLPESEPQSPSDASVSTSTSTSMSVGGGIFWMFIAVRSSGRHEGLDQTVDELFGTRSAKTQDEEGWVDLGRHDHDECIKEDAKAQEHGWKLGILESEHVGRKSSAVGRVDECAYRLFKIGWVR